MRVHVLSVSLALSISSQVVASSTNEKGQFDVSRKVQEALLDLPGLLFTVTQATHSQSIDPDDTSLEQSWFHRELQFTAACNATYEELWQDQALNDADAVYSAGIDEALGSLGSATADTCVAGASPTELTCDFSAPINGETEYKSACTAAGGEVYPFVLDLTCTGTVAGQSTKIVIDLPTVMDCIPTSTDFDSCVDGLGEMVKEFTDVYDASMEEVFSAQGFQDVSCIVADVGGEATSAPGGGDSSSTSAPEGGEGGSTSAPGGDGSNSTTAPGGGESSNASYLGHMFVFVLMALVSLTLG